MSDDKQATNEIDDGQPVVKSQKQLEKEAVKAAKLAKLQQKQAAQAVKQTVAPKEKVEVRIAKYWLTFVTHTLFHEINFFAEEGESCKRVCLRGKHRRGGEERPFWLNARCLQPSVCRSCLVLLVGEGRILQAGIFCKFFFFFLQ